MSSSPKPDYLEDFDHTIPVNIDGMNFQVPANNSVLRIFQYLELEQGAFQISYKDFCWNADCHNCLFRYRDPVSGEEREGLACSVRATEGMTVVRLPRPIAPTQPRPGSAA